MKTRYILIVILAAFVIGFLLSLGIHSCTSKPESDTVSIRVDSFIDTMVIEKHDTLPAEKGKTVIKYVTIPSDNNLSESENDDSISSDGVTLPVVQKTFSDDSTYTAYVSGPEYDQWPKLDSVTVRQLEVTKTIKETITLQKKAPRIGLGITAGPLYDVINGKVGAGVCAGVYIRLF